MKIVITGGAGFIGSHIVDAYVQAGHEVYVIDDLSTGKEENIHPQATFYAMDLLDPSLPKLVAEIRPDYVNHHAAQMDVRRSVADPLFDARVNILGLLQLLEASRSVGIKKFVYASSGGTVYGEQEIFPASEDHPLRPMSPYGVSKLSGEYYLGYYYQIYGISYIAFRYANVYGPRQSSHGEAGVVAIFLRHLLSGGVPTIHGDGMQTRDFIYVADVVAANLLALGSSFTGALNIGTGNECDIVTLFSMLRDQTGNKCEAVHGPAKEGEQRRSALNYAFAQKVLGWGPRTSLKEGLEKTVAYYRDRSRG